MTHIGLEQEHRAFYRVAAEVPVQFRFLSGDESLPQGESAGWRDGRTENLSVSGLLLVGMLPEAGLLSDLLCGRLPVALRIALPDGKPPVLVLARAKWLEGLDPDGLTCRMGLRFQEILRVEQERILEFVIRNSAGS
jgi:hypothetical protein